MSPTELKAVEKRGDRVKSNDGRTGYVLASFFTRDDVLRCVVEYERSNALEIISPSNLTKT